MANSRKPVTKAQPVAGTPEAYADLWDNGDGVDEAPQTTPEPQTPQQLAATLVDEEDQEYFIDFTQIRDPNAPAPEGMYNCVVVAGERTRAKKTNAPMMVLDWKIVDGEYEGKTFKQWLMFNNDPYARWKLRNTLEALGYAPDHSGIINPEALVNRMATLELYVRDDPNNIDSRTGERYPASNQVRKAHQYGTAQTVADLF